MYRQVSHTIRKFCLFMQLLAESKSTQWLQKIIIRLLNFAENNLICLFQFPRLLTRI